MNAALACTSRPEPKPYYGQKLKQIEEMFQKYVPQQYDSPYAPASGGCSGMVPPPVVNLLRTPAENAAAALAKAAADAAKAAKAAQATSAPATAPAAAPHVPAKRRWSADTDDARLWTLYTEMKPTAPKQWKQLADKMFPGCQPSQCKSAVAKLKKAAKQALARKDAQAEAPVSEPPAQPSVEGAAVDEPPAGAPADTGAEASAPAAVEPEDAPTEPEEAPTEAEDAATELEDAGAETNQVNDAKENDPADERAEGNEPPVEHAAEHDTPPAMSAEDTETTESLSCALPAHDAKEYEEPSAEKGAPKAVSQESSVGRNAKGSERSKKRGTQPPPLARELPPE